MEIAIPLLALGGLYVVSNQKNGSSQNSNQQKKEKFTNMGMRTNLATRTSELHGNYLPNTNTPPQNYPVPSLPQIMDTVQEFENPNAATDKYFDQNVYYNKSNDGVTIGQNPQQIYSLSGNYLDSAQFKHNNMVPFNGGKVKGHTYDVNIAESVLDNMVGSGSQIIKKVEQAPLFKPEENVQWAYGMPNQSDFFQSRVVPGMKNNNVKPFESEYVGPGLDQGYSAMGTGGFNSGMEARDKWLDKTVDQLRVATNPKLEYTLDNLEGPAQSAVKNVGIIGRVEKQGPDTFFINSQDRWLTTTGAEKGPMLRSIQETGVIRRPDCASDYTGAPGTMSGQAGTAPQYYEPSRRVQLDCTNVNPSSAIGKGGHEGHDSRARSFTNTNTNRSNMKQPDTLRSGFSGAIGAVIAPLLDFMKPTRKEEVACNMRVFGEAGTAVPQSYVVNMNDKTPTTMRETTLYSPEFYIDNQKEGIYVNNYTPTAPNQRNTTECNNYIGPSGGAATQYGDMSYTAAYNQHNNDILSSTIDNRPNIGGTQVFNQYMNMECNKQDCTRYDYRVNPAGSILSTAAPSVQTYGRVSNKQTYNENINCERIQPDLLMAFRSNPYTHSLTTSV
jgi:hypothetical protein